MLHGATQCYMELHNVTESYFYTWLNGRLHKATHRYTRLHMVIPDYMLLHEATQGIT